LEVRLPGQELTKPKKGPPPQTGAAYSAVHPPLVDAYNAHTTSYVDQKVGKWRVAAGKGDVGLALLIDAPLVLESLSSAGEEAVVDPRYHRPVSTR
jgi:hypothetical protein